MARSTIASRGPRYTSRPRFEAPRAGMSARPGGPPSFVDALPLEVEPQDQDDRAEQVGQEFGSLRSLARAVQLDRTFIHPLLPGPELGDVFADPLCQLGRGRLAANERAAGLVVERIVESALVLVRRTKEVAVDDECTRRLAHLELRVRVVGVLLPGVKRSVPAVLELARGVELVAHRRRAARPILEQDALSHEGDQEHGGTDSLEGNPPGPVRSA